MLTHDWRDGYPIGVQVKCRVDGLDTLGRKCRRVITGWVVEYQAHSTRMVVRVHGVDRDFDYAVGQSQVIATTAGVYEHPLSRQYDSWKKRVGHLIDWVTADDETLWCAFLAGANRLPYDPYPETRMKRCRKTKAD